MPQKEYYTIEEMFEYLDKLDEHRITVRKESALKRAPFKVLGFQCIYNFCKTSFGWVPSYEECCEYCVHSIIAQHGSREDKIQFNQINTLGKNYIIPITNKEVALSNKRKRSQKNNESKRNGINKNKLAKTRGQININKASTKMQNNTLKEFKKLGIPTLRRTKTTLFHDVFRHNNSPEDFVYIKGLQPIHFFSYIKKDDKYIDTLLKEINSEIERQRKMSESNLPFLSMEELEIKLRK